MSKVMVDNWFMENVVKDIQDNKIHNSDAYSDLLMAIVLWDDVFYPQNKYNWWNSFPSSVQNILQPIDDETEKNFDESFIEFFRYKNISYNDYTCNILNTEEDIISLGAIRYMMLSNCNGCDYLPCRKRQEFLSEYYDPEQIGIMLSRMTMQELLKKEVEKYYNEIYKKFVKNVHKTIKMPVLTKFIFDNTPNGMLPVEYAFHLKYEEPVIKYRQYLDKLQTALSNDIKEFDFLVKCSDDVVSDVISMDSKKILSFNVCLNISPIPSFQVSASVNVNKETSMERNKIPLTFLRDLTEHAIKKI